MRRHLDLFRFMQILCRPLQVEYLQASARWPRLCGSWSLPDCHGRPGRLGTLASSWGGLGLGGEIYHLVPSGIFWLAFVVKYWYWWYCALDKKRSHYYGFRACDLVFTAPYTFCLVGSFYSISWITELQSMQLHWLQVWHPRRQTYNSVKYQCIVGHTA